MPVGSRAFWKTLWYINLLLTHNSWQSIDIFRRCRNPLNARIPRLIDRARSFLLHDKGQSRGTFSFVRLADSPNLHVRPSFYMIMQASIDPHEYHTSIGSLRLVTTDIPNNNLRGSKRKRKKKKRDNEEESKATFIETTILLPHFERHFALFRWLYLFVLGRIRWIVAPKRFTSDSGEFLFWSYIGLPGGGRVCNKKRWCCFRKSIAPQTVSFLNFYKCNDSVIINANSKFGNYQLDIKWSSLLRKFSNDPFAIIK